jgi:uncharacterized protein (UPF0264 family)
MIRPSYMSCLQAWLVAAVLASEASPAVSANFTWNGPKITNYVPVTGSETATVAAVPEPSATFAKAAMAAAVAWQSPIQFRKRHA